MIQLELGPPLITERAKGFDYGTSSSEMGESQSRANGAGLYSVFSSPEALQKYAVSEAHVKVVNENVKPNVEGEFSRVLPGYLACLCPDMHPLPDVWSILP